MATDTKLIERPTKCEDKHLEYLDALRESGVTNMYGASPYLSRAFRSLRKPEDASAVLVYWMRTFLQRHP